MAQVTRVSPAAADAAPAWYALPEADVTERLHVDVASGLSADEAARRLEQYGPNRFAGAAAEPRWRAFARQYRDLMQTVLLAAGALSLYPLKQLGTGLLLLALTVMNAILGLHQEGKAAEAVEELQKMMIVTSRVRRSGELVEVPAENLVPGDVVSIEAGDVVPADGRLLQAATLEVDESALTGESMPAPKAVETVASLDTVLGDRTDMVHMNTNVTRGSGEFVVTATGMATEVGHISAMLEVQEEVETPLTRQLTKLTRQILVIGGVAVVLSIVLNLSRHYSFDALVVAAVAFAVSAIPTGLPAVVTAILSGGTQALAQAHAIVKRLRSAETLGSTSAINSDKTGTLTLNQMTAVELTIPGRRYAVDGNGYASEGRIKHEAGQREVALEQFLLPMALCSDAVVRNGELIGDPTEGALVVLAEKGGLDVTGTRARYPRVAELPFDATYKLMATFHRLPVESDREVVRAFVKGAPDQLLGRGSTTLAPNDLSLITVDDAFRQRYLDENERLAKQGLRVLATARKDFDPASFDPDVDLLPLMDGLTLLALVGIVDPPRPAAKTSIATAQSAGIQVRMITGDHAVTAEAIARELGIRGRAITGAELGAMSDEELRDGIDEIGVIARVTPEHKVRLVETLKAKGRIVAMTGDGVNDAPALKAADIGIAMGITGTEVSKEAAAMILTDDDFSTIVRAVEIGRGLYDNLKKYVRYQMGCLIGFVVTFLGSSIANIVGGVPFLPLQTLYVNLPQGVQAIGLGFGKPDEGLMERKPRPPDEPILTRALLWWVVTAGAVMGLATLGLVWWADDAHGRSFARTMGMTSFAIANVLFSFTARSDTRSVFNLDTLADRTLLLATGGSILAIIIGTETRLCQRFLGTEHLDGKQWLLCIGVAIPVVIASEIRKWLRRRRERQQTASTGSVPSSRALRDPN